MASKGTGRNGNNNETINQLIAYIQQNIRYVAAAGLLIVLILVLAMCAAPKKTEDAVESTETVSMADVEFEVNANEQINDLLNRYYTAYAAGDIDTIASIATPLAANEQTYIAMFSQYVDAYQNITCYTKSGLDASSYMVYVSMEIKFTSVDTPAPGLEFFYLRTNDDGNLYIDNLYSPYNLANKENALDTSVQSLLQDLINQEDAIALQEETQQNYDAAVASDDALRVMVEETIPGEITNWKNNVLAAAQEATENPTEETTEAADDGTGAEATDNTAASSETVYTLDKVNVRVSASTNGDKLGTVDKGTALTRTGTDGEWSQVDYNGYTGYVKTEYLTTEDPSTATTDTSSSDTSNGTEDTSSSAIAAGTVISLPNTCNIRSGMSETADRVGTAYQGDKVTVVMSYSEGWTKVTWNNKTGYIKTSLLQ